MHAQSCAAGKCNALLKTGRIRNPPNTKHPKSGRTRNPAQMRVNPEFRRNPAASEIRPKSGRVRKQNKSVHVVRHKVGGTLLAGSVSRRHLNALSTAASQHRKHHKDTNTV